MGWNLFAKLAGKQVSAIGDRAAQALAAFDPESATEVDREALQAHVTEIAHKLAAARQGQNEAQTAYDALKNLVDSDTQAAGKLLEKHEAGTVSDSMLKNFTDELEQNQKKLTGLKQALDDASELVATCQEMLDMGSKKLETFDETARKLTADLAQAKANKDREEMRQANQAELTSMKNGLNNASSGLGALSNAVKAAQVDAETAKTMTGIGQKPLDVRNDVEEARRLAASDSAAPESAADRLRRLTGKA